MDAAASAMSEPFYAPEPTELEVSFGVPRRQPRWSVALRGPLVLPDLVVAAGLNVVGGVLALVGWFPALVLGRLPRWIAAFELTLIAYSVRLNAYATLLVGEPPPFPFSRADYSIAVRIGASRLSRFRVLFRPLLAIPVSIISAVAGAGLLLLSPVIWLITLVGGRTPQPLFSAAAAVIRYHARCYAYTSLVTDMYPRGLFGDDESGHVPEWASETERQRHLDVRMALSGGAKRVMGLIVVLGITGAIAGGVAYYALTRPPAPNRAVVAAEVRLDRAGVNAVAGGRCSLRCERGHERNLGEAYFRFASSISRISFPPARRGSVAVVVHFARQAGHLLLAASKTKDGGRAQGIDPTDPGDSLWFGDFDHEIAIVLGRVGIFH